MFTDTLKNTAEPVNRLNKLVMDTCEGIVDAQMTSIRGYLGLLEEQTKAVTTIRDIEGVKSFVEDQPERFNQLVKRMSEDLQQFARVAEDFRNEASQLFQSTVVNENDEQGEQPATPTKQASTGQKKSAPANS